MKFFDSHAHYYDEKFAGADDIISALLSSTVSGMINVGTDPDNSITASEQAKRHPGMFAAAGIHPTDGQNIADIYAALDRISALLADPGSKCVAIGEIGLDYHYPDTDRKKQTEIFLAQIEMAKKTDIPVIIHDRDAHGDIFDILVHEKELRAVLHSFSGSAESAKEYARRGYMISFSGTITFKNAPRVREAAEAVPMDQLLIETDCPYLAPHPLRGTVNHSGNLVYTNRALSLVKGITEEECAALTEANAKRFFGIDK